MMLLSTNFEELGTAYDAHGSPIATMRHYPAEQLLYLHWTGNLTAEEVIKVGTEGLKLQREMQIPLLLNDKTDSTGDWAEAMPWLEYEWLPEALNNGLRAFAYVFSPDLQNQFISVEFVEHISKQLPAQLFYDVNSAWSWLHKQHQVA